MIALSVVNIRMLSISTVAAGFDLLYYIVFLIVVFIHRKNFSPSSAKHHTAEGADDKSFDYFDMEPLKPQSIAFTNWNITSLIFLLAVNFIAFSVMVDDTVTTALGAMGETLPVEPSGSLQKSWNFKIEVTQTVVLGCQLLAITTALVISAFGRRRIILEEENRLQEAQYEF